MERLASILTATIYESSVNSMADPKSITIKTFEFKLRTNKKFVAACEKTLDNARFVYSCASASAKRERDG